VIGQRGVRKWTLSTLSGVLSFLAFFFSFLFFSFLFFSFFSIGFFFLYYMVVVKVQEIALSASYGENHGPNLRQTNKEYFHQQSSS